MMAEKKTFLLLSSLLRSYDHLVTTVLYGKENLDLEEVTLSNSEIIKMSNPIKESSRLMAKEMERSKNKGRSKSNRGKFK